MRFLLTFAISCLLALPAFALSVPEAAMGRGALEGDNPRVETKLLFADSPEVGGSTKVGVYFEMDPEWHIYWKNSGEAGLSTQLSLADKTKPELSWQAPDVFLDPSGKVATFGYGKSTLVWFEHTRKADSLEVTADFLVCKIDCIPGRITMQRSWEDAPADDEKTVFATYEAKRAKAPEALQVEFAVQSDVVPSEPVEGLLSIACDSCEQLKLKTDVERFAFIPDVGNGVSWETKSVQQVDTKTVSLRLAGVVDPKPPEACQLKGVVHLMTDDEPTPIEFTAPYPCETASGAAIAVSTQAPAPQDETPLWLILILALLGGMILNLMPCVFPVLAIKVASFVELAHEDRGRIIAHDMAYTGGIVSAMGALAAVVIGLKQAGVAVGWGFQFQEPWFVVGLTVLMAAFALNMFGVYEVTVGVSSKQTNERSLKTSFGEGVLAVILATPCSAPMLGTAVGFALAAPSYVIALVFIAIGLGLAMPFVILTLIPNLASKLPRPGAWMNTLKTLLGFALLGTGAWLLWVLGQSVDNNALAGVRVYLMVVALALWIFGKTQFGPRRWFGWIALIAALASGPAVLDLGTEKAVTTTVTEDSEWKPWSHEAVQNEIAAGRPVFVDFTADWCITCKVNENGVMVSEPVLAAFKEHNVALLKGDWTRRDETIRQELAKYGKAGVPLYLVISPDGKVQVLPELLTEKMILDAVASAASTN